MSKYDDYSLSAKSALASNVGLVYAMLAIAETIRELTEVIREAQEKN